MNKLLIGIFLCTIGGAASAAPWIVDSKNSNVNFISTKKVNVAEVHHFNSFSGQLDDSGKFALTIDLASVWTNIEIRDIRMKELLFEVGMYPTLVLSSQIDLSKLADIPVGATSVMEMSAELSMHQKKQTLPIQVTIAKLSNKQLLVVSTQPVIINAADFGYTPGIEKLREVAGLTSISQAVPVSFVLNLSR
ncbi:YceI family protein [Shewanella violacea]|uniref:YceI like family protein n=1 Tax=Shewanella violacea (strain JCM 10179 / CIP 106290 / LMG 19151 / DSS12) TaxID=637905 RepID=D4ZLE3_SHEVD|nr:YceI family protein [Shewanella violacea]BAJ02492.1 YceI like family protein [Shewanella violacea DSS12]